MPKILIAPIKQKYEILEKHFDERTRRIWAAAEAQSLEHGGIKAVSVATGISRTTIMVGLGEIKEKDNLPIGRIRKAGGGRKKLTDNDGSLLYDLESLVEPLTRGDPESPLRWTCKSTRRLADEMVHKGHRISARKVAGLLYELGYSLQANEKAREGVSHPDRNAQFEYINTMVKTFQKKLNPVISVDTKKKELVGNFKNGGQEWQPKGQPEQVLVHDFEDKKLGKAIPYGVYDITKNEGWVSVGIDHDTSDFAVDTILQWWKRMGKTSYPGAKELLITADGGGSNSSRSRLWKIGLQRLANQTGMDITVCHFPPGTSKWNKIEHRMFSFISQNWRSRPLVSHEVVVNLISSTITHTGLIVKAKLNQKKYDTGIKVTDDELSFTNIRLKRFHGDWNYTIASTYKN